MRQCLVRSMERHPLIRGYTRSKYHPTKGPEARLFSACLAAVLFPAGMFIYGWTAFPSVPWIGMVIGVFVGRLMLFRLTALKLTRRLHRLS